VSSVHPRTFAELGELLELLRELGSKSYGGEAVTQLEHGLQAATRARQDGEAESIVCAALLHDIGHLWLMREGKEDSHAQDLAHADVGARILAGLFGPKVTEPIRLHVAAKRYLVTTEADYGAKLSPESLRSLREQGGTMSAEELAAFEAEPFWESALIVRRLDEEAKVVDLATPELDDFVPTLRKVLA
jgi:phosphonate degradation associated HDIG domain protein